MLISQPLALNARCIILLRIHHPLFFLLPFASHDLCIYNFCELYLKMNYYPLICLKDSFTQVINCSKENGYHDTKNLGHITLSLPINLLALKVTTTLKKYVCFLAFIVVMSIVVF